MLSATVKVTGNGQVSIPAEFRRELNIEPGDRLFMTKNAAGNIEIKTAKYTIDELQGIVKPPRPGMKLEDVLEESRMKRAFQIMERMSE